MDKRGLTVPVIESKTFHYIQMPEIRILLKYLELMKWLSFQSMDAQLAITVPERRGSPNLVLLAPTRMRLFRVCAKPAHLEGQYDLAVCPYIGRSKELPQNVHKRGPFYVPWIYSVIEFSLMYCTYILPDRTCGSHLSHRQGRSYQTFSCSLRQPNNIS